ncbi:unnamed protein product [Saccharomyces cerevisiae]|nr:unnamed protein product [Saccharomyces cerevisiae]GMC27622.1 unnamed protein product [Saccharomyces cerevisiae]
MEDLTTKEPTFCQFFFNKETKKLTDIKIWLTKTSSSISTLPTATAKHKTFFNWNLMVDLTSVTLPYKSSL